MLKRRPGLRIGFILKLLDLFKPWTMVNKSQAGQVADNVNANDAPVGVDVNV